MALEKPIYLVTGGCGFIGTNFILEGLEQHQGTFINLDKLTYAGNPNNLKKYIHDPRYIFIQGDICDIKTVQDILSRYQPDAIINFAAESHVDRSILKPNEFVQTNIVGTAQLLQAAYHYWNQLNDELKPKFRYLQISTDEVYGTLKPEDPAFTETTAYAPNSPYSASKAAADFLVRSYYHTYQLPALITNCSNNYGPYQYPEKLIPLMIHNALQQKPLPIYGDGLQVRDWLYVKDHCTAIFKVLQNGRVGETYNIGGCNEMTNLDVVQTICSILDEIKPAKNNMSYSSLMHFVKDRPGHDRRYAIDIQKIQKELGWMPEETFATGIYKTIKWYLENQAWIASIGTQEYAEWIERNYEERVTA